jgi:hypothetical protein
MSIILPLAPAIKAMFLEWSFMCPFWIPSEAKASSAAKFWARPTDAITIASSWEELTFRIFKLVSAN